MADIKVERRELIGTGGVPVVQLWHDNGDGTYSPTVYGGTGGGGGGGAATIADGADVTQGAIADAVVAAGAAGTLSAKLRRISADISSLLGYQSTPTAISNGRTSVTTSGTAVQLNSTSTVCKRVTVAARDTNTDAVVVGGSGVVAALATRSGVQLNPGDSFSLLIDNLNKVYLDAVVNGDGVVYAYTA